MHEYIQLINKVTLDRARGQKAQNTRIFRESNTFKAYKKAKLVSEPRKLKFKLLLAKELIKVRFTFRVSRILVKGEYKNEAFPRFTNKPNKWDLITISVLI